MATIILTVSGRTFRSGGPTTLAHDAYILKRWRAFGLAALAPQIERAEPMSTGTLEAEMDRLIADAFESGLLYEIMAGMLVEDGAVWSVAQAANVAAFFGGVTDATEKQAVYDKLSDILTDFFAHAVGWLVTSRKYSTGTAEQKPAADDDQLEPIEETPDTITGNGTRSFETSRGGTPIATAP